MSTPEKRASERLHQIRAETGRDPTPEETDAVVRQLRQEKGRPEYPEKPNKWNYPYQDKFTPQTSEWGQSILDSQNKEGVALLDEYDPRKPAPTMDMAPPPVDTGFASARAQIDAILKGDTDTFEEDVAQYSQGVDTVEQELIGFLEQQYSADFVDQGVLENINNLPEDQKYEALHNEFTRLDSGKADIRNLLALNLMRQGLGGVATQDLDKIHSQLSPRQAEALLRAHRMRHLDEMNRFIDRMAAREGEGFTTAAASGEIIMQDVMPFYGATTRIIGTNMFLPDDVDINVLRRGFPGEVRQEIREWWVNASAQERRDYLRDLDQTWKSIRRGSNSKYFTRYLAVENLMGIFTEDMLYSDDPTDTFDRVMGNLDTALGMLVGVGLFAKRGKSIFELWSRKKYNQAAQLAGAGGSRGAQDALDQSIKAQAQALGWTVDEIAIADLPKPKQLELDFGIEVDTDSVKHTTTPNAERRRRIMEYTDDAEITLLSSEDLGNATRRELAEWERKDGVHVFHKMSTVRGLENNVGIDMTVTFGEAGGTAWNDLGKLLDDMYALDPYQEFRIMRRNADGVLEDTGIKFADVIEYRRTGRVPYDMEQYLDPGQAVREMQRYFGGRPIDKVSSAELSNALDSGWIPADMPAWGHVRRELDRRANPDLFMGSKPDPLTVIDGDELFVQIDKTHFFDSADISGGATQGFFRDGKLFGLWRVNGFISKLFPPNSKFDRLYQAAARSYRMEEAALEQFADITVPFDKLSSGKKEQVATIIEYVEDFAKDAYHTDGVARVPTRQELLDEFPDVDQSVWDGYWAMNEAMEGMYDVLARRLYRDFNNKGHVTIRATDDKLPNYSGRRMRDDEVVAGKYYDPLKREIVELDEDMAKGLVEDGGGVMELDFPITSKDGEHFTRILARKGDYEFGKLSETPLTKYQGYHYRFYEDPWYVIKRTYDPVVNGQKVTKADVNSGRYEGYKVDSEDRVYYDEAVRTAVSRNEAERFFNRRTSSSDTSYIDNGRGVYMKKPTDKVAFVIKPSKQINNTEGSLYQTQELHQQGRLFWDERSYERLPDTYGNRAKISDPSHAMQKGLALAMRQSTQEGLFKTLKRAFVEDYGDLPKFADQKWKLEGQELRDIERSLDEGFAESFGETRKRYAEAREMIRYMRSQLGTDSFLVPAIRQQMLHMAQWLGTWLDKWPKAQKAIGWAEKQSMGLDPFARMRKIAYGAFMVLRPVRQFALQSMQISFLTGLAPTYIGTGKVFRDAIALRRGLRKSRAAGFDDGWSDSSMAKAMGLSKKEYKRLVEEFQRSGLLGSVNTHAFNTRGRNLGAQLPDKSTGIAGRMMYKTREGARNAFNKMARGFELGEQNNLTFSYLVALKRFQKQNKIDDLTKMSRSQWDAVTADADGLALGMTRPNKFAYQSGATGMVFQFMSFQHRALLSMAFMNPAIGKDAWKVILANYALWGSNILGLEDYAREWLTTYGIDGSKQLWPNGPSIQDAMTAGMIELAFNNLGSAISENWNDLNLGIFAPGAAIVEIYKGLFDFVGKSPMESLAFLGPASNPVSGFMKGWNFMRGDLARPDMSPGEKLLRISSAYAKNILPQFNDANQTWLAWQYGEWRDSDGDKMGIQAAVVDLAARGLMGVRPEAETDFYRVKALHWENQENIKDWVDNLKPIMKRIALDWIEGEYTDDEAYAMAAVLHSLTEGAPEGIRREIYERVMNEPDFEGTSVIQILAENLPNASMNLRDMIPYMNKRTDLTQEQKAEFQRTVEAAIEGSKKADEIFRQLNEEELRRRYE